MKGKLIYDQDGWWVQHAATSPDGTEYFQADTMLHPDDVKFLEDCSLWFDNIEGKVIANPDVEFEMVIETVMSVGNSEEQDEYTIRYAKLIPSKESSYQLEYNRYMKTFVNSNLNPPTIEQFVDKVNTDSDFAKYWGPGGKEQQKQLITEIMDLDAKDGLYDTVSDTVKELIEQGKQLEARAKQTLYTEEQVREAIEMASLGLRCADNSSLNKLIEIIRDEMEVDLLNAFYDGWLSKDLVWKVAKKLFKESLKQGKKD